MVRASRLIVGIGASLLSACASSTSPTSVTVISIIPSSGTTLGGTHVTIAGSNFSAGANVTIGGVAATDVSVASATTITATTPQHAAGVTEVVVATTNGQRGTVRGAFTFVAPTPVTNTPPAINSIVVQGSVGPREPAQFASFDETVRVTAVVTDAETPVSQLTYQWSSDVGGAFTGDGAIVSWTAPHMAATPATLTLKLMVTERYQTTDNDGLPITAMNTATGSISFRIHDSIHEINDLAVDFLNGFSKQFDPAYVVRNFTDSCSGKALELGDVKDDNDQNTITSYSIGTPRTTVGFIGRGGCPFRGVFGDACAQVPVEWHFTSKATGVAGIAKGTDQVAAVLENDQWRLCASDFNGNASQSLDGFRSHRR